ncbi:MAG: ribonuclease R [Rhodanobacteraceae bacterium]|nr:ribonuclease R [Rhodanobacteraceae bacterium]
MPKTIKPKAPGAPQLLGFLQASVKLMKAEEIADELGYKSAEGIEAVRALLEELVGQGRLLKNRRSGYGLADKMDLIAGSILANSEGFGFLRPDEGAGDIYLPPAQMRQVLHGDRALVSVVGRDKKDRPEGAIVSILSRRSPRVVGRYLEEAGFGVVAPDDQRIHQNLLIPRGQEGEAKPGDVVVAEIVEPPSSHRQPVAKIVLVLGEEVGTSLAIDMAIESHSIPNVWPETLLKEIAKIPDVVRPAQIKDREDLRELPLVTIDGEDARDFDDAVWCEPTRGGGYKLYVAIADVATYVQPGTALDNEAQMRGTSVYFPNRVVPMLPEKLSNGICSLKPEVERLCLACELRIDATGETTRSRFFPAVMRSAARLTYNQVWQAVGQRRPEALEKVAAVLPHLENLHGLYKILARRRSERGALDFEGQEVKFQFDEQGQIDAVKLYERNDAHRMIEECMIAANVAAAKFLKRSRIPALYRVHPRPPTHKYEELAEFMGTVGMPLPAYEDLKPEDLMAILARAKTRPDGALIEAVVLRSQSLATYTADCDGHFGLALSAYAHFTSPIRRYPDLLVHRAIHYALGKRTPSDYQYTPTQMADLGRNCSAYERRADEATRDVADRLKCAYMERHLGDEFDGVVTGVASFGLFVEILETRITGMVHVTQLPNDYYHYDPRHRRLVGERLRQSFQLADRVRIKVLRVDALERRIDFRLAGDAPTRAEQGTRVPDGKPRGPKPGGGGKRRRR